MWIIWPKADLPKCQQAMYVQNAACKCHFIAPNITSTIRHIVKRYHRYFELIDKSWQLQRPTSNMHRFMRMWWYQICSCMYSNPGWLWNPKRKSTHRSNVELKDITIMTLQQLMAALAFSNSFKLKFNEKLIDNWLPTKKNQTTREMAYVNW